VVLVTPNCLCRLHLHVLTLVCHAKGISINEVVVLGAGGLTPNIPILTSDTLLRRHVVYVCWIGMRYSYWLVVALSVVVRFCNWDGKRSSSAAGLRDQEEKEGRESVIYKLGMTGSKFFKAVS
jgi:hypothetical protein